MIHLYPNFSTLPSIPFHTVSFLLNGLGLRNGETLHGLVLLLLRLVLVRLILVLTVRIDQHSTVERVAVPPRTLIGPWDAIDCEWSNKGQRKVYNGAPLGILLDKFYCDNNRTWRLGAGMREPSKATTLQVKDTMRARKG